MGRGILKIFNEKCDKRYVEKGLCHAYFHKEFNTYPSVLSIKDKDYLIHIKKFHDPILVYVALYLYHNYVIAQEYFEKKSHQYNNAACGVLNRWLDQQKSFYTHFGKCSYNTDWWNISIEPLWEKLKGYYPNKTCVRSFSYYDIEAARRTPNEKYGCYHQMSENYTCYKEDDKESLKENCTKLSILFYLGEKYKLLSNNLGTTESRTNNYCDNTYSKKYEKINYNPVLKAEKTYFCESITSTIALPIIVTVLGTIFLVFFLNEFTPIGSKLQTPSKNKVRLYEQFNEETAYKEYKKYRNNNQNTYREKNIIYYQSMNE